MVLSRMDIDIWEVLLIFFGFLVNSVLVNELKMVLSRMDMDR